MNGCPDCAKQTGCCPRHGTASFYPGTVVPVQGAGTPATSPTIVVNESPAAAIRELAEAIRTLAKVLSERR